jgi:hypothetical protein
VFQASAAPWTGSAGISGYTIADPAVWIELLGSDPDWSSEDNKARVLLSATSVDTDKGTYDIMYSDGVTTMTLSTSKGQIKVSSHHGLSGRIKSDNS